MYKRMTFRRWRKYIPTVCKQQDRESLFLWEIDASVPYKNKHLVRRMMREALSLSPFATYAMIYELCSLGGSWQSQLPQRRYAWKSLNMIPRYFSHPLLDIVMDSANIELHHKYLPTGEALRRMEIVRQYPGSHYPLVIVSFNSPDEDEKIDGVYDAIRDEWNSKSKMHLS